jgi:hypothetical protein
MRRVLALAFVAGLLLVAACETEDTTAPTVSIVNPVSGDTLAKGDIVIKAVATDNKAVAKVEFYQNGTILGTDNVGGAGDTFRYTWSDTAAQTAGAHVLTAKAYDNASTPNTATSTAVTVYIAGGGSGTGPTEHGQNIVGGDSIWYPSGNPHIVTAWLQIYENGKLIIKPGCVVKFADGAGFEVGHGSAGELSAVGTADSMITFTSNNGTPNPGDWSGFDFYDQTRTSSQISYCDIDYGCYPNYAAVNVEGDQHFGIDHTTIHNSSKWGIWFGDNKGYITGFTGNTITTCGSYPIYGYPDNIGKLLGGNTLTGNSMNAIWLGSGTVAETDTWVNQGVPYFLSGGLSIGSSSGAYLTIAKGTTVQLGTGNDITVGNSVSGGLMADSVTFTSGAGSPQKGDWEGIWFYPASADAQCQLTRCDIGYGGANYSNMWIEDAKPTITDCSIHDSKTWGIELHGSDYPDPDSLLAHNTFANNDSGDVFHP